MSISHTVYFFLACCSGVKILKPADNLMQSLLWTVIQSELHSKHIPNAMSYSKSRNTSLLAVILSSQNERVFILDLNDLTLKIIFDAWWTSMNVESKLSIASNNSRHTPSWRWYLHCGLEVSINPGIMCFVGHRVLHHASEDGTSRKEKHWLSKAHIACTTH